MIGCPFEPMRPSTERDWRRQLAEKWGRLTFESLRLTLANVSDDICLFKRNDRKDSSHRVSVELNVSKKLYPSHYNKSLSKLKKFRQIINNIDRGAVTMNTSSNKSNEPINNGGTRAYTSLIALNAMPLHLLAALVAVH